jgi:erythromycin esterase-like protein
MPDQSVIAALRQEIIPLGPDGHIDRLLHMIGNASIVLLGEASHGTREFYLWRARITQQLLVEKGFDAIAIEADWPDALQASCYAQLAGKDVNANQALAGFQRFPQWMWRNTDTLAFLDNLREHNRQVSEPERRIGVFGLDLYSLRKSMDAVIHYLDREDPEAARRARERYSCFDHLAEDPQRYGYVASYGLKDSCASEVVRQLRELSAEAAKLMNAQGAGVPDALFYAQQNARVAQNAERYYRAMFSSRDESWNVRDTHMADTLDALRDHLGARLGRPAKVAVWAHNSHLGDARATEMGQHGQLNLGQLVRERHPGQSFILGFTTHAGKVTAASEWDAPAELKPVQPSIPGSIERLLHDTALSAGMSNFLLPLRDLSAAGRQAVGDAGLQCLERAIGVIYRPETERISHYFKADVARQFDALIHIDHSAAVQPMERSPHWTEQQEVPETYPSGL